MPKTRLDRKLAALDRAIARKEAEASVWHKLVARGHASHGAEVRCLTELRKLRRKRAALVASFDQRAAYFAE